MHGGFMADVKEECGITAVYCGSGEEKNNAMAYIYKLLLNLQGRGQLSTGFTTFKADRAKILATYKRIGHVNEAFMSSNPNKTSELFRQFQGSKGIGHVRYATSGKDDIEYAQPLERIHGRKWKWFSFCFNGNLANYSELKNNLLEKTEYHMIRDTDTEIIMHYISKQLMGYSKPDLKEVFSSLTYFFDGSYNISFINGYGEMAVARDPIGFKPLVYSIKDNKVFAASESNALLNIGISISDIKFLQPGQMIYVNNDSVEVRKFANSNKKARCMFEWVYFSNVASVFDEKSVYITRTNLGKNLAKIETEKIDSDSVVVPVPDTAKAAGDAFAFELGIPSREGLVRNRFVGRTFIEGENHHNSRQDKIKNKFTVLKEVVHGKKVFLVDDSIVRGNTTKSIVRYLKEEGKAKEVHVRVTCPPIMCPCFYGIDMSTIGELIAPKFLSINEPKQEELDAMAKELGADSLVYLPIHLLASSIGLPSNELCMACLNGEYPTEWGKKLYEIAKDNSQKDVKQRTYQC